MKITLYMATSIDGYITRGQEDSSWVSETDWDQFYSYIKASDAVIMGRKTMEQFDSDEFPIENSFNIVLTSNEDLHKEAENLSIREGSANDIVNFARKKGFENLLIIGGENTNGQFLRADLIDEIVLSVHPLIIGQGLTLFGKSDLDVKLQLLETKEINNELVQLRYKVLKEI
ncbi:hypothetical protein GF360_01580 [candidate division WWE3 bacterium]|nr:hypothetical protein [candidate division WWE3 bacterium]